MIKSVPWKYSCYEEYLEEFNKGKILKYFLLLAELPRNRLGQNSFSRTNLTIFILAGSSLTARDENGRTPFLSCAQAGRADSGRVLLQEGIIESWVCFEKRTRY